MPPGATGTTAPQTSPALLSMSHLGPLAGKRQLTDLNSLLCRPAEFVAYWLKHAGVIFENISKNNLLFIIVDLL